MSNLDKMNKAIDNAKANSGNAEGIEFSFEGVEPTSWSDFLYKTDIGQIIAQNGQINFKDAYGRRTRGAFTKLDENTFAQISLLGNDRSDKCYVGITFFPREELKKRTEILIDYDNPNYMREVESAREALVDFEDFTMESIKDRKQRLVEALKEGKNSNNKKVMSNQDIHLLFNMISNGELSWDWLGDDILHTPQFKNDLINYIINESPKNEKCGSFIQDLISMDGGGHSLEYRDYFFDEDILENKEFIDNLNKKYFNGEYPQYSDIHYENATEAITFSIFSKYHKDRKFASEEFLEEKLDFIGNLIKENDGDLGFLKGVIPYIVEENPEFVDKIFDISTDQEIISKILEIAPSSAFENPEFLKKTLAVTTDEKLIGTVLSKMSVKDKINPEMMLGIIENCPNVLEVFKEKYDNWDLDKRKEERNVYYTLTSNEDFQKGLYELITKRISQSEIETTHYEASSRVSHR